MGERVDRPRAGRRIATLSVSRKLEKPKFIGPRVPLQVTVVPAFQVPASMVDC